MACSGDLYLCKMSNRKSRTLFVRNLPFSTSSEKLSEAFEQVGPIKTAFIVVDKASGKCKGYGYVQFAMLEDAVKAIETITHCDGRKIFLSFADAKKTWKDKHKKSSESDSQDKVQNESPAVKVPENKLPKQKTKCLKKEPLKRCRLIVRNLAFKCKKSDLKSQFEKFGEISEVSIPFKDGKLSRGFGFVQFTQLHAAQKAVTEMNAKEILGRPVAVDWAVAKDRFQSSMQHNSHKDGNVPEEGKETDSSEEEKDDKAEEMETSDSDSENENDEEDSDVDDEDDEPSESSSINTDEEKFTPKPERKSSVQRKSDVDEGRTLFVRNIPFEAEKEEIEEIFQEFGDVAYVCLVFDKVSGQPRGTAFVQFKSKESADLCLAKSQLGEEDGGITLQGRPLLITLALNKSEAQSKKSEKKDKEQKDNRNLFLAREGLIRAGTKAAIGITAEDMKKRMRIEQMKREKLKNINVFVSSTRLCVHNLPSKVSENELRKVLRQTVDDSAMKITECRVMRNLDKTSQKGVSKSLGFAFVNFSTHEHALKALHGLNNSLVFGENKRPIVEFSLENKKALEMKARRLEKSKIQAAKRKAEAANKADKSVSTGNKKPRQMKLKPDKTQDIIAKSMHTGPKGMPKRMGPKIRHRNRGKGDDISKRMKKGKKGKKFQQKKQKQQPTLKVKKKKEVTDKVDKLIQKHQMRKASMFKL